MEKEIIKLLQKISRQLEEISRVQDDIRGEIGDLYTDLVEFRQNTLANFEKQLAKAREFDPLLN
ncbi:MAG: hypothetical protein HYU99_07425 [Deltaproteobacteria bacterium]|nr:hypothetical protein [Deltaproteobacteria bacterium]